MKLDPNALVRSLRPREAALRRELRLRALRDAPEQFCDVLDDALARPSVLGRGALGARTAGSRGGRA